MVQFNFHTEGISSHLHIGHKRHFFASKLTKALVCETGFEPTLYAVDIYVTLPSILTIRPPSRDSISISHNDFGLCCVTFV